MSPKVFTIRLNKFPAVYTPGETIVGEVLLELREAKTCRGVSLRFKGRAKVHWSERRGSGKDSRTVHYTSRENYFVTEVYVVGSSSGNTELVAGQHIFPFTFPLPTNIPSSFEHAYGSVQYNVKAVMDIAWALDDDTLVPFTVNSPLELDSIPSFPIQDDVHEDYCCCLLPCISRGFMEAQIFIPGSTYGVGDPLEAFVDLKVNSSSVEVCAIVLKLTQRLEFYAQGAKKTKTETIQLVVKSGPFRVTSSVKVGLQVPAVMPSGFPHCSIINVVYHLKLRLMVSDCHCDSKKEYEIKIGSRAPVEDSRPIAPPTAPMVEIPLEEIVPVNIPMVNPGPIGFIIQGPSAPVENPDELLPPPSYESVMAQVDKK